MASISHKTLLIFAQVPSVRAPNWHVLGWQKSHFRYILLYYFRKGKNAVQARKKLYDVYGKKSLIKRQCQNWFARFRSGDFDLKDTPCSGHKDRREA